MSEDLDETFRPPLHLRSKVREVSQKLFDLIKTRVRELGWCALSHGSMERDLDIVATPWSKDACSTVELVERIRLTFAEFVSGQCYKSAGVAEKPFGRKTFTLYACTDDEDKLVSCDNGSFPFIDLSIIDLRCHLEEEEISNVR